MPKFLNPAALTLIAIALLLPSITLAGMFDNPLGINDPEDAIVNIIKNVILFLLSVAGFIALAAIVYGGILLVVGGGFDKRDQMSAAKKILTWAIIGLIVIGLAATIINAVSQILSRNPSFDTPNVGNP